MKQEFRVEGMTCGGCSASVEDSLKKIDEIKNVEVSLTRKSASFDSDKIFSTKDIEKHLDAKYSVFEALANEVPLTTKKSSMAELKPLLIILFYIISASILLHIQEWDMKAVMLDFMGLFFIVFSFFKILDVKGFANSFPMYDPLAKQIKAYAHIYPFIELCLGLMFLFRWNIPIALIVTFVILGITTIGVSKALLSKKEIKCACLGTVLNLPMTKATFIENAIMLIMAMILFGNYII